MDFDIQNGLGNSLGNPTPAEMLAFLEAIDVTDEEHAGAWLALPDGFAVEWNGDGRVTYNGPGLTQRHMANVSPARTVDLWLLLVARDFESLEREPWLPGNGYVHSPERAAAIEMALLSADRKFYDILGPERADVPCGEAGCTRGAISLSIFCRPHHFAMVRKRSCPFDD